MAEQKNQNEHLNVEDALTQSEAFLIKYKNAIIGGVVAVIIIVAGIIMYKNLYAEPREEKAQAAQKQLIWQKLMLVFATHNLANMKKQ